MAESHVTSALKVKRAQIAGQIIAAERQITELRTSLVHLDGALKVFAGDDVNPEAIPPRLPRPPKLLTSGERMPKGGLTRLVLTIMRESGGGITAQEVARRYADAIGEPIGDNPQNKSSLRNRVDATLYGLKRRGVLTTLKDGYANLWYVAEADYAA